MLRSLTDYGEGQKYLPAPQKNCVKNLNGVEEKKKNMCEPRIQNNISRSGASLFFFPKRSEDLAIILQCMFLFVLFLR
jgi:hypothetical protein